MNHSFKCYKGTWINSVSPHKSQKLSDTEMSQILKEGGLFIRNTYDFDTEQPTSFWYVIKDSFNGLDELSSKVRNQVRKALKTYDIEIVSDQTIIDIGLPIFNAALETYKVQAKLITQKDLEDRITKEKKAGIFEYWCVFEKVSRKPVALSINCVTDDCAEYQTLKAIPEYLKGSTYPYYGLIYEMNRYYLEEKKLKYVNDGARSITEHSNIQPFLIEKFKFRKAYCRLQIKYRWWLGIFIKILYPFRNLIPILKVKAILYQEEMRRNQKQSINDKIV